MEHEIANKILMELTGLRQDFNEIKQDVVELKVKAGNLEKETKEIFNEIKQDVAELKVKAGNLEKETKEIKNMVTEGFKEQGKINRLIMTNFALKDINKNERIANINRIMNG